MGTLVTIQIVPPGPCSDAALDRAFAWFHEIETRCTRFSHTSELMQLTAQLNTPVPCSTILFEAVQFAIRVAEETGGAFDPTVGQYTWRDLQLNARHQTITIHRPLTLDLGAVAKGLAVDAAARELAPFQNFAIDAGGDLYLGGTNPLGQPWSVGIRHPRLDRQLIHSLRISNQAVCTSGDYERGHHILDSRTGQPAHSLASATVVAPTALLADCLATAAFVLGPIEGLALLNRLNVEGLLITPDLERYQTPGFCYAA